MLLSGDVSREIAPKVNATVVLYREPIDLPTEPVSGRALILMVEDLYNRLSTKTLQCNPFWRALVDRPKQVSDAVYHGMCIENYHLLYRESYFDAPALSFAFNQRVRQLFNEFYCEEIGHDRLLLQALESIGIDEDTLFHCVPLRETMALCNALSYWARHDPLFFFTTLGPLEGRDVEIDSFVVAARAKGLPDAFIAPIETHANINKNSEHGLLTRELFDAIPAVSAPDAARVLRQTALFIALYDQFYTAIWRHYRRSGDFLRRINDI
jgi:hypothetical protein